MKLTFDQINSNLSRAEQYLVEADNAWRTIREKHHLNISLVQARILYALAPAPAISQDLMKQKVYGGTNLSYNVAKLAKGGFLTKSDSRADDRHVVLTITDKGRKAAHALGEMSIGPWIG